MFVRTVEIGLIAPMSLNCFVVSSVTGVPAHRMLPGICALLILDLTLLLLIILFPALSLTIPRWAALA